jgi:hypothetical protein
MTKNDGRRIIHQWKKEIINEKLNKNPLPSDYYSIASLSDFLNINIQSPRPENYIASPAVAAVPASQGQPAVAAIPAVLNTIAYNKEMQKYAKASSTVSSTISRHLDEDLKKTFTKGSTVYEGFNLVKLNLNHDDADRAREIQLSIDNVAQGHNESVLNYVERFTQLINDLLGIRPINDQVLMDEFHRKNSEKFLLGMDRDDHDKLSVKFETKNITTVEKMEEEIKKMFASENASKIQRASMVIQEPANQAQQQQQKPRPNPPRNQPNGPMDPLKIFIGNISFLTTENDLRATFTKFGDITEVTVPIRNGKLSGYGFVGFKEASSATNARLKMDGKLFGGRLIKALAANRRAPKEHEDQLQMTQENLDVLPSGFTMSVEEVANENWFPEEDAFDISALIGGNSTMDGNSDRHRAKVDVEHTKPKIQCILSLSA